MNVNNKSRKNSFLSNNLKNTSDSNISNQNHQNNLADSNKKKNTNNIFSVNYNTKTKGKILMNEILSPKFSNDHKIQYKTPFSVDKENGKMCNNSGVLSNSIFNKLGFDNAISKKAINSLMPQEHEKIAVNNNFKYSINEKNEKSVNIYLNNNSNNLSNLNNLNNNKNNQYFNNCHNNSYNKINNSEKVGLHISNNEPVYINKYNNANKKNIYGLNLKGNDTMLINNFNNMNNNTNSNLNLGVNSGMTTNSINNNINLISNNNFNSAEVLVSPIIPLLRPQQINVNINNYNINNYNYQSEIPLKSAKKFLKYENINSSNNKNTKNLENELSLKNFSKRNSKILSINNINPLLQSCSNINQVISNENISELINFEDREFLSAGAKKGVVNGNNARFNINRFFNDQQLKKSADVLVNNLNNENIKNVDTIIINKIREKSSPNYNLNNVPKDKDGNDKFSSNNKKHIDIRNTKSIKIENKDDNIKINIINHEDNINFNYKKENEGSLNTNKIKNIPSKEIIFDSGYSAKNIESVNIFFI